MGQKVMAITGTRTGIGRGMAEYFLSQDYRVAGCSRGQSSLASEYYDHAQVDVGDEGQVVAWIRSIKSRFGSIDILVCNAGLAPAAMLATMTPAKVLEPLMRTNVCGTYYACREAAKVMVSQRAGRIITISSMAVGLHEEGTSAYSASKSAIVEMTKVMAKELAPLGITCNVLAPSILMTEAVQALGEKVIERALSKLAIRRVVTIQEVCKVISFFAAPDSACITGQTIYMGLVV
jgi:3-oxoacyl-[acyl-carrier protein] reductase